MVDITLDIIGGEKITLPHATTLLEVSKEAFPERKWPVLVAKVDNELQDLSRKLLYDATVEFLDITDPNGFRTYQRSCTMLLVYAAKAVLGRKTRVVVAHSINKNYFCELPGHEITDDLLAKIEGEMRRAVQANFPITKCTLQREEALHIARELGLEDKISLLKYRHNLTVSFYKLDWMYNYLYGEMAPSTGCLDQFQLVRRARGFMLQFPNVGLDYGFDDISKEVKIAEVFAEASQWARILKAGTVGALNDKLCSIGSGEIIRVTEALHEKKIALLADQIVQECRPIVLIAGPSSSGKTTFAARLGIQLQVNGAVPHVIGLDNYYLDRENCPRDADGNYDFETINAIDTAQINKDLQALLAGERVQIPTFNFLTGKREYKGRFLALSPKDVLILEGIHGLNDRVSEEVPPSDKFKIFISAMTQINIDDHNRIPTTDTRLVRRIVRDYQYRGASAAKTISMWPSVLRGESKYIFPHQERADAFFNSALVYEMCVLKQYAEPLLFGLQPDVAQYTEARRLIKFLSSFLGMPSDNIPPNSILREFIGGGCFNH
ncbi:MAG: nucleoside kinase [Defluviitaleaceae bacterium]|nr:nucleoside kinase [Defluviitaleaceae bacterium]MCL2240586.1 nucleoside kinase [Defluviitaleaceae bacterium]